MESNQNNTSNNGIALPGSGSPSVTNDSNSQPQQQQTLTPQQQQIQNQYIQHYIQLLKIHNPAQVQQLLQNPDMLKAPQFIQSAVTVVNQYLANAKALALAASSSSSPQPNTTASSGGLPQQQAQQLLIQQQLLQHQHLQQQLQQQQQPTSTLMQALWVQQQQQKQGNNNTQQFTQQQLAQFAQIRQIQLQQQQQALLLQQKQQQMQFQAQQQQSGVPTAPTNSPVPADKSLASQISTFPNFQQHKYQIQQKLTMVTNQQNLYSQHLKGANGSFSDEERARIQTLGVEITKWENLAKQTSDADEATKIKYMEQHATYFAERFNILQMKVQSLKPQETQFQQQQPSIQQQIPQQLPQSTANNTNIQSIANKFTLRAQPHPSPLMSSKTFSDIPTHLIGNIPNVSNGTFFRRSVNNPVHPIHIPEEPEKVQQIPTKRKLADLIAEINGEEYIVEPKAEEILMKISDDFIEEVMKVACVLARERGDGLVSEMDLQFPLERKYNIRIPGKESINPTLNKSSALHNARMASIHKYNKNTKILENDRMLVSLQRKLQKDLE